MADYDKVNLKHIKLGIILLTMNSKKINYVIFSGKKQARILNTLRYKMIEIIHYKRKIKLRKSLFWDKEITSIDAEKSNFLIIERVISRGSLQEFKQLVKFY